MNKVFVIGRDTIPEKLTLSAAELCHLTLLALPGVSAAVKMEVELCSAGAELDVAGLYICNSHETLSFDVTVRHTSAGAVSRQLFKGVVSGSARAEFDGLIYVAEGALQTKAYQENHSLLLSCEAVSESRPQLEIYADDVECSHGATSGHLNAEEQFYMRSRGIPEKEAERLQIISFISPVVSRLSGDMQKKVYESLSYTED